MPQADDHPFKDLEFLSGGEALQAVFALEDEQATASPLLDEEFQRVTVRMMNGETHEFSSLKELQEGEGEKFVEIFDAAGENKVFAIGFWVVNWASATNTRLINFRDGVLPSVIERTNDSGERAFLSNHINADFAHIGVVSDFRFARDEERGVEYSLTHVSARDPESQQRFLRGVMRSFSSGVRFEGPFSCSACSTPFKKHRGFFGDYMDFACDHRRGEMVDGKPVEIHASGGRFYELSTAPVGAVNEARSTTETFSATHTEDRMPQGKPQDENRPQGPEDVGGYKAKFEAAQETITKLTKERDEALAEAQEIALKFLAKENLVVGQPDEGTKKIFAAFGAKGAVDHIRKHYRPQIDVSDEELGHEGDGEPPPPAEAPYVNHALAEMDKAGIKKLTPEQREKYNVTPTAN